MADQQSTTFAAESLGSMLRRLRRAAGLSQEALAERASISVDAVAALERGRRKTPRASTVRLLADALALSARDREALLVLASGDAAAWSEPSPAEVRREGAGQRPLPRPTLIGREQEEASVLHLLLRRHPPIRLLTLTGPGGIGKTSLSLRVAAALRDEADLPVTFVDLSSASGRAEVVDAVAAALEARAQAGIQVREAVLRTLGQTRRLLVLDNFEQVIDAADLVRDILERCPQTSMLITSRVALRLRGEHQFRVPPLAVPDDAAELETLRVVPAVRLFTARAQAVEPAFELTAGNREAVAEICRRLEGVPLAIELAAARIRVLQPGEMLGRLERILPMLRGGARDLPDRQKTMRATIDWSHELLTEDERWQFAALAVFSGGFTLAAVEKVCGSGEADRDVVEALAALVDHSLVSKVAVEGEQRLVMLETIREYAAERLAELPDAETLREAHGRYVLDLAQRLQRDLLGPGQKLALGQLRRERENLRGALRWFVDRERPVEALTLATSLWRFWQMDGRLAEGLEWFDAVLGLSGDGSPGYRAARAAGLHGDAALSLFYADLDRCIRRAEEALVLMRELGDRPGIMRCLNTLANAIRNQGFDERSIPLYEEALEIAEGLEDTRSIAVTLNNLGSALRSLDLDRAQEVQERSLILRRQIADAWGIAITLTNLAHVAVLRGDFGRAESAGRESLALHQGLGDQHGVALAMEALARGARMSGDRDAAIEWVLKGLELSREVGDTGLIASHLLELSEILTDRGMAEPAAQLLAVAWRLDLEVRGPGSDLMRTKYDEQIERVRRALRPEIFDAAWTVGSSQPLESAIETARVMAVPRHIVS